MRLIARFKRFAPLRMKLTVLVAAAVLVTSGVMGLAGYLFARKVLLDQIHGKLSLLISNRKHRLLDHIHQRRGEVAAIAGRPRIRQLLIDYAGGQMDTLSFLAAAELTMREADEATDGIISAWLVDVKGQTLAASSNSTWDKDFSNNPDFQSGFRVPHMGIPRVEGALFRVTLTAPVLDQDGKTLGVVVAIADAAPIKALVSDPAGLPPSGKVLLGARIGDQIHQILAMGIEGEPSYIPADMEPGLAAAISGSQEFMQTHDHRGVGVLAAPRPVGFGNWGMVAKLDIEEAYAPIYLLRFILFGIEGFILACGMAVSYAVARSFTRPVKDLSRMAEEVACGNLKGRIKVRSRDEIGRLGRSFNHMTRELGRSYLLLEQRNASLHAEIVERERAQEKLRKSEEQLRQSQKMEAVGRLAGGVAHDFNNLLTAINGYSDLLLDQLDPNHPLYEGLREIQKAGERAASLTHQLLAYSRKQVLAPRVLNLNTVISDMDSMLKRLIGEDIELVNRQEPELGFVKADRGQVEQVIMNLALNARDAMPQGGRLSIQTSNLEMEGNYSEGLLNLPPGAYVELSLSDSGSGMDDTVKSHLFEPFFTTKGVGKGTGLGLPTVYGIVKQSGGHIAVYSQPGHGSVFRIYLPRAQSESEPGALQREGIPSTGFRFPKNPALPLKAAKGETILVVEDEEAVRNLIREVLERNGYKVLVASSGSEALVLSQEYSDTIHLLLTDIVMRGMKGPRLAGRLLSSRSGLRILYISGYTDDAIVRAVGRDSNPEGLFMNKPFSAGVLAIKVREALDRNRHRQGDGATHAS